MAMDFARLNGGAYAPCVVTLVTHILPVPGQGGSVNRVVHAEPSAGCVRFARAVCARDASRRDEVKGCAAVSWLAHACGDRQEPSCQSLVDRLRPLSRIVREGGLAAIRANHAARNVHDKRPEVVWVIELPRRSAHQHILQVASPILSVDERPSGHLDQSRCVDVADHRHCNVVEHAKCERRIRRGSYQPFELLGERHILSADNRRRVLEMAARECHVICWRSTPVHNLCSCQPPPEALGLGLGDGSRARRIVVGIARRLAVWDLVSARLDVAAHAAKLALLLLEHAVRR
mmetsp:Transcript_6094/g.24286  ORF Transcript_6094/g.24286 Transcript_6094/m.24286 type:complete len:290 (-) Transcript_6094:380-1249(-)